MTKVLLVYPPTWSLVTGSPHLALPLLKAFLDGNGVQTSVLDMNWEAARWHGAEVNAASARRACHPPTLENMNRPYFAAEDRLEALARRYQGTWNAQVGFAYDNFSHTSSTQALEAAEIESPFGDYIRQAFVPLISADEPDVLGLCIASVHQLIPALQLCRLVRGAGYRGFILLGGNTVSRLSHEMAIPEVFRLVDGLVSFQGEAPLLQLCRALETRRSLDSVPQLTWLHEGRIRTNHAVELVDPSRVPTPDFGSLPVGQYWGTNYLNLLAARGCYYGKCSFCAIPYGWGEGGFTGVRSPEKTCDDMLTLLERHGINRFKFVDEALSPSFMRALATRIIAEGALVEWEGYVRFEPAWYDPGFVELIARAGFRKGYFGLELIPSATRDLLHKRDRPHPETLLSLCCSSGVNVHLFCMFGFPGTSEEEARRTVDFLLQNQDRIDTADIFPWALAKHTRVEGAEPIPSIQHDWALEFRHRPQRSGVLGPEAVVELAARHEEALWREVPRLLHPTYRLTSPWTDQPEA